MHEDPIPTGREQGGNGPEAAPVRMVPALPGHGRRHGTAVEGLHRYRRSHLDGVLRRPYR